MNEPLIQRLQRLTARLMQGRLNAEQEARLAALLNEWEGGLDAPQAARAPKPAAEGEFELSAAVPIQVWCDGSCAPNPGPGGWGAIVEQGGRRMELSGGTPRSTNNIMEMTAAIEALRRAPEGASVHVTTDSRYLMDGITRWLPGWKRKHWRKADGKPVLNRELWQALDALVQARTVRWAWVEGHSGHPENERCDALANAARRSL